MAFTVETGTGIAGANSYVSVATADTYHSDRGNTSWDNLTTAQKQARLIKASFYIDGHYSFPGVKFTQAQGLEWPRYGAVDAYGQELTGVPVQVVNATCEAGLEETLVETLDRGGAVASESVGQISVSYFQGAKGGKTFPQVDQLMRLVCYSGQVKVIN